MTDMKVVSERSGTRPVGGVYFGYTAYALRDGTFAAVLHTRTYEPGGMKIESKWDTDLIPLEASSVDAAAIEAAKMTTNYLHALTGQA